MSASTLTPFEIPHGASDTTTWVATLDYSRLWGNFAKKLALSRLSA